MANTTALTRSQIFKRARDIMKKHPIMDGSGHLYLTKNEKVPKDRVENVIAFVHHGLARQGISRQQASTVDIQIKQALRFLPRRKRKPHHFVESANLPQSQFPTLKLQKATEQETVKSTQRGEQRQIVVQVTVKKARNFHYPRDLQGDE